MSGQIPFPFHGRKGGEIAFGLRDQIGRQQIILQVFPGHGAKPIPAGEGQLVLIGPVARGQLGGERLIHHARNDPDGAGGRAAAGDGTILPLIAAVGMLQIDDGAEGAGGGDVVPLLRSADLFEITLKKRMVAGGGKQTGQRAAGAAAGGEDPLLVSGYGVPHLPEVPHRGLQIHTGGRRFAEVGAVCRLAVSAPASGGHDHESVAHGQSLVLSGALHAAKARQHGSSGTTRTAGTSGTSWTARATRASGPLRTTGTAGAAGAARATGHHALMIVVAGHIASHADHEQDRCVFRIHRHAVHSLRNPDVKALIFQVNRFCHIWNVLIGPVDHLFYPVLRAGFGRLPGVIILRKMQLVFRHK